MAYLFSVNKPTDRQQPGGALGNREASKLAPKEDGGQIDVIKKFPWTLSNTAPAALEQTPFIKLKEFYLTDAALNQLLKAYNTTLDVNNPLQSAAGFVVTGPANLLGQTGNDLVYENLYDHTTETGFSYTFPYFENPQNTQNNWTARSSYDFMIQLQKTLAEVQAQAMYLGFDSPINDPTKGARDYIEGYEKLLQGDLRSREALDIIWKEAFMAAVERGATPLPSLRIPGFRNITVPPGEAAQRIRKALIDFSVLQVDYNRTIEQLQIALKTGTGNLGSDPVLDKPHVWSSSQPRVFNITFPLYNINAYDPEKPNITIGRNWELCYLLTYQNLYNKSNLFTGTPPVFYEVDVPGVYYTKAAYVSNIAILNVGNIRNQFLAVGSTPGVEGAFMSVNVPDAYLVNMTLVDFFIPSRNFLDTINNPRKREVIKQSGS